MAKIDFKDLVDKNQPKREPNIGRDQVDRLLNRAQKDLASATKLIPFDEAGGMDFIYKALFHAANALIRSQGYRPGPVRQHQGLITAIERILGKDSKTLILKFDQLRKKRNQFEYLGVFEMGKKELESTMEMAKQLVDRITGKINSNSS